MIELPYDIWALISDYLPPNQVQGLYSVNRHLFHIALDLRYKVAYIAASATKLPEGKAITLFSDPFLCSMARTLRIELAGISRSILDTEQKKSFATRFITRLSNVKKGKIIPSATVIKAALDILPSLTSVSILVIEHLGFSAPYRRACASASGCQLFPNIWKPLGDRLTVLDISPVVEDLPIILPTSQLLRLETFSIRIHVFFHTTDPESVMDQTLIPFLLAHKSTIRNLTINVDENVVLNVSAVLQKLEAMTCIRNLDVKTHVLNLQITDFSGHYQFLKAQRNNLTSLTLKFFRLNSFRPALGEFYSQPWCLVPLPHLQELSLFSPPVHVNGEWVDYAARFSASLVTLKASHCAFFTFDILSSKSLLLGRFSSLRHLELSIFSLSPDLLAVLARDIPHLRYLYLDNVYMLAHQDKSSYSDNLSGMFAEVMESHRAVFMEWKLQHLEYASRPFPGDIHGIKTSLVRFLPNVRLFCGKERDEFVRSAPLRND